MVKRGIFYVWFFMFASLASGGTILHNVDDKEYLSQAENYDCVVPIACTTKDGLKSFGSAVILNTDWIVTAAHIVKDCSDIHILLGEKVIEIEKVIIHETFKGMMDGGDIALCETKVKVEIKNYPELYEEKDELNKICEICGIGRTGTGLTGGQVFDFKKRSGNNIIDSIEDDMIFCTMNKPGDKNTKLEYCISYGDSGGGLFIGKKLAGINSMVLASDKKPDSTYGDESGHTRISRYKEWIKSTIKSPKEK